jgi:hypothetical protein
MQLRVQADHGFWRPSAEDFFRPTCADVLFDTALRDIALSTALMPLDACVEILKIQCPVYLLQKATVK